MVQWEGTKQTGLSIGQTSGEVNGEFVERPSSVSTSTVYRPGKTATEVKIERDSSGRPIRFNLYKYDQYGNLMSVGEQRAGRGNLISTTPRSRISQEQAERYNIFQQKEYQQDIRLAQERQSSMDRLRQQFGNVEIRKKPAFQLPIFSGQQERYQPPKKRYYAVSYPSGFGSEKIVHEYKPGEKFKVLGFFSYKEPKPGKLYKSDILGFTHEAGDVPEETIRSSMKSGVLAGVSTTDIKLAQLGNMLAVSPFIIKYPFLKKPVSIKSKGKPPLEKIFGSKEFTAQKKAFGEQRYFVETKPAVQKPGTLYRKMFGGEAKQTPKVNVLKNMFGSSAYQKPRKTTVMDILLVQPSRQRQITRPVESMWRQVFAKPSEVKPMIDFEAVYQQQAVRNILQYTKLSKAVKPTPQITSVKPTTTRSVYEQINLQYQYRRSQQAFRPQSFKPVLKSLSGTQYKFMLGMGASSGLLSGLMQGQRQNQRLGQLFGQQFAQAQKQGFKQRFAYDFGFKYPQLPRMGLPETTLTPRQTGKPPSRQPPKTPPRQPPKEPPMFRLIKLPPPIYMPSFEMPAIFGTGRRRKQKTREKVIVTRMLSLKDLFGR